MQRGGAQHKARTVHTVRAFFVNLCIAAAS